MTQENLAFRSKLHRTYIGDLERGLKSPTLDVIEALALALGAEPSDLVAEAFQLRNLPRADWVSLTGARQRVRKAH